MANQPDKLIFVVHGVGDPLPGETLSLLARSVADDSAPLIEQRDVIWLPEKSNRLDHKKTFATHSRSLQYREQTLELAEVFWGDLSQVKRGLFGALMALFQILFGMRYVAFVAADQPIRAAKWLQRLGLISSRILHGPVLAVSFFLALLTLSVSATQLLWEDSYRVYGWSQFLVIGCAVVAFLFGIVGWNLTRSRVIERFWFWAQVTAVSAIAIVCAKTFWLDKVVPELACETCTAPGLIFYCRVFVLLLGLLWFTEMLVLLGMGASAVIAAMHPNAIRRSLYVAFLIPALSIGIWGHAMPMMWITAKEAIPVLHHLPQYSHVFDEAIPLLGVQFLMMLTVASIAGIVLARYLLWKRSASAASYAEGRRVPRLIVNRSIQDALLVSTCCGALLVFVLGATQMMGNNYHDFMAGRAMAEINKYAIVILVPMGGMLLFLLPRLRVVFDITLDVVNHFYFRATNVQDALDDDDEFDIHEATFQQGSLYFSRRDTIQYRFKRILAYYRDNLTNRPELIVVSHSQGTMMAIEALNDEELDWIKNRFSKITLVTMGSPFTHLYQHYFGSHYPPLGSEYWTDLESRIDRWVNVFRVDDFVGTELEFPKTTSTSMRSTASVASFASAGSTGNALASEKYTNHPVGPRGHVSYWDDCEVLDILRTEVMGVELEDDHHRRAA